MNKKWVLIGAGMFISLVLIGYAVGNRTSQQTQTALPAVNRINVGVIPLQNQYGSFPNNVVFSYTGPSTSLPTSLPSFAATYSSGLVTNAGALAKQLGIAAPVSHPVPYVYDWNSAEKHFSYNDQSHDVSYLVFASSTTPSASLTPQAVLALLSSFSFVSPPFTFVEVDRRTTENNEGNQRAITVVTYQTKAVGQPYPFLFIAGTRVGGEIHLDAGGRVITFSFFVTPGIAQQKNKPSLTTEQTIAALNNQKGYLSNVDSGAPGYAPGPSPSFTKVGISSITPAFLYVPEANVFVPIYICDGVGVDERGGSQLVRYLLRATE